MCFTAATGALERRRELKMKVLLKRALSAIVLIPVAIYLLHAGASYAIGLGVIVTSGMLLEWILMSFSEKKPDLRGTLVFFLGLFYILGSSLFLLQLLAAPEHFGIKMLLMLLIIVWSTDTGAYLVGTLLEGPKLVSRISPHKTWSGFLGGLFFGGMGGSLGVYYIGETSLWMQFVPIVIGLSFIGQLGDLLESAAKRYWNVKDSGCIIPGHGGLLDRLDSLLAIAFFLAVWEFWG